MPARERTAVPRRLRRIGARPRQRGPWSIGRAAQSSPLGAPDCAKRLMAPKAAERGGWNQRRTLYPALRLRSQRPEETASGRLPAWTCDESPRWRSYGSGERRLGSVARSASVRRECSARAGGPAACECGNGIQWPKERSPMRLVMPESKRVAASGIPGQKSPRSSPPSTASVTPVM